MIENEVKIEIVEKSGYEIVDGLLRDAAGVAPHVVHQLNHYFDTSDLRIARASAVLRIRLQPHPVLTYKNGSRLRPGHFRAREYEVAIEDAEAAVVLERPMALLDLDREPVRQLRDDFGPLSLELAGSLENERRKHTLERFVVELDLLRFPDGSEEYELEIECADDDMAAEVRAWCENLLRGAGVAFRPSTRIKLERLLRRQGRI